MTSKKPMKKGVNLSTTKSFTAGGVTYQLKKLNKTSIFNADTYIPFFISLEKKSKLNTTPVFLIKKPLSPFAPFYYLFTPQTPYIAGVGDISGQGIEHVDTTSNVWVLRTTLNREACLWINLNLIPGIYFFTVQLEHYTGVIPLKIGVTAPNSSVGIPFNGGTKELYFALHVTMNKGYKILITCPTMSEFIFRGVQVQSYRLMK